MQLSGTQACLFSRTTTKPYCRMKNLLLFGAFLALFSLTNLKSTAQEINCEGTEVLLVVGTDSWASEIYFDIVDENGDTLFVGAAFDNFTAYTFNLCLQDGCYTLNAVDYFGDGWNGGVVSLLNDDNGVFLIADLPSGSAQTYTFGVNSEDCAEVPTSGCTDPNAVNFNPNAIEDDGTCFYPTIPGCTDVEALNFNPEATFDDGSCEYEIVNEPCDANSLTFVIATESWGNEISWNITNDFGDILYEGGDYENETGYSEAICLEDGCYDFNMFDSFGDGWNGAIASILSDNEVLLVGGLNTGEFGTIAFGVNEEGCAPAVVLGCTNPNATNFNPEATFDDGSCVLPQIPGCIDPNAINYNPQATINDGSCEYETTECEGTLAQLYVCTFSNGQNVSLNILAEDSSYVYSANGLPNGLITVIDICLPDSGCVNVQMANNAQEGGWYGGYFWIQVDGVEIINETLNDDYIYEEVEFSLDGSCGGNSAAGCMDPNAYNYNEIAIEDDGSCIYSCNEDPTLITYCYENNLNYVWTISETSPGEGASIAFLSGYIEEGWDWLYIYDGADTSSPLIDIIDGDISGMSYQGSGSSISVEFVIDGIFDCQNSDYDPVVMAVLCGSFEGCGDPEASNYVPGGTNNEACEYDVYGCTDATALNYNPEANEDDDSCEYAECEGTEATLYICTFGNGENVALNLYSGNDSTLVFASPVLGNGAIMYFDICLPADCITAEMINTAGDLGWYGGYFWIQVNGVNIYTNQLDQTSSYSASNFNAAGEDCGPVIGCMDQEAINYNPEATEDDDSCFYGCDEEGSLLSYCYGQNEDLSTTFYPSSEGSPVFLQFLSGELENNFDYITIYDGPDNNSPVLLSTDGNLAGMLVYSSGGALTLEIDSDGSVSCLNSNNIDEILVLVSCGTSEGCTDPNANNYNPFATTDNGSCDELEAGCTDPSAINYNPNALVDDGSCDYIDFIYGCTDITAINYNPLANEDDGSCQYNNTDYCDSLESNAVTIFISTQQWGQEISWTLTDQNDSTIAVGGNYNSFSNYTQNLCLIDGCYTLSMNDAWGDGWNGAYYMIYGSDGLYAEGTLLYGESGMDMIGINSQCGIAGCMDSEAINYNPMATIDDGNCVYGNPIIGVDLEDLFGLEIELNAAPNPFVSQLVINVGKLDIEEVAEMRVINMMGQLIQREQFIPGTEQMNFSLEASDWSAGNYFISITQGDQQVSKMIIKQ